MASKQSKRRILTPQFKFHVALEALRGLRSVNEIAATHKVHPIQVTAWKKELRDGGSRLFERTNAREIRIEDGQAGVAELERAPGDAKRLERIRLAHARGPTMGTRQLGHVLERNGPPTSRWKVIPDDEAPRPSGHPLQAPDDHSRARALKKYPYLLRETGIVRPDQVWAINITCLPWRHGHVCLAAIVD